MKHKAAYNVYWLTSVCIVPDDMMISQVSCCNPETEMVVWPLDFQGVFHCSSKHSTYFNIEVPEMCLIYLLW